MIENFLREAASLQDVEARTRMIHEIAHNSSKEVLDELISILQDTQSPLIVIALEAIEAIGYPNNASAIPMILWYIDNSTPPLFEKALQILLRMGPSVLPNIVQIAQENETMDALVINALSKVGYYVFVQLKEKAEIIAERVLEELTAHPEESLEMLLYVLSNPIKIWWEEAVKTVSAIGYPRNAPALPLLIAHACLGNDLAEKEAIEALVAPGPKIVVPYLVEALWDQGQTSKYLSIKPEDIFCVNARVILRRNNFDPPAHSLSKSDNLQGSAFRLLCHQSDLAMRPPPAKGASPPGHPVVNGRRRDERTRGTPQSQRRPLVSSARPTTAVQVERTFRPPLPRLAHSRCPQSRASPPPLRRPERRFAQRQHSCARVRCTQRRCGLRQLTCDPLLSPPAAPRGGLSSGNLVR
jgi:hypothetical protein